MSSKKGFNSRRLLIAALKGIKPPANPYSCRQEGPASRVTLNSCLAKYILEFNLKDTLSFRSRTNKTEFSRQEGWAFNWCAIRRNSLR